jgi:hypothetical protein
MTKERAKELVALLDKNVLGQSARAYMTTSEIEDVNAVWQSIVGTTSFNDALRSMAKD